MINDKWNDATFLMLRPVAIRSLDLRVAEVPPIIRDPYTVWLRTLQAGAIIGALAALTLACWSYAWLSYHLRSYPRNRFLQTAFPFVQLGSASMNWMSVWLLTTPWPLYDPQHERRIVARVLRFGADLLRLIVTAIFLVWSLRVWGLIGASHRRNVNGPTFDFMMTAGDVGGFVLLWIYLYALAKRIRLRGLRWRVMVVLVLVGAGRIAIELYPAASRWWGARIELDPDQTNIRDGLIVLLWSMAMLALGRYAWALSRVARKSQTFSST